MQFLISIIPILVTIIVLEKFAKNKNSIQIILLGIEITIVGVAIIAMGGGGFSSSDVFYCNLVGFTIIAIGFTSSIYGFLKK